MGISIQSFSPPPILQTKTSHLVSKAIAINPSSSVTFYLSFSGSFMFGALMSATKQYNPVLTFRSNKYTISTGVPQAFYVTNNSGLITCSIDWVGLATVTVSILASRFILYYTGTYSSLKIPLIPPYIGLKQVGITVYEAYYLGTNSPSFILKDSSGYTVSTQEITSNNKTLSFEFANLTPFSSNGFSSFIITYQNKAMSGLGISKLAFIPEYLL